MASPYVQPFMLLGEQEVTTQVGRRYGPILGTAAGAFLVIGAVVALSAGTHSTAACVGVALVGILVGAGSLLAALQAAPVARVQTPVLRLDPIGVTVDAGYGVGQPAVYTVPWALVGGVELVVFEKLPDAEQMAGLVVRCTDHRQVSGPPYSLLREKARLVGLTPAQARLAAVLPVELARQTLPEALAWIETHVPGLAVPREALDTLLDLAPGAEAVATVDRYRRVAVVGGNGQIGRLLIPRLLTANIRPVALIRSEEQRRQLEGLGAEVRVLDLERADPASYVVALDRCLGVVFTAGAGQGADLERIRRVDLGAAASSAEAARLAGIDRFVQVSALGVDEPVDPDAEPEWRTYVEAKRAADQALRASGLAWTIVRPGRLTDQPGSGRVTIGGVEIATGEVPRADVADLLVSVLRTPSSVSRQISVVSGEEPITEALGHAIEF